MKELFTTMDTRGFGVVCAMPAICAHLLQDAGGSGGRHLPADGAQRDRQDGRRALGSRTAASMLADAFGIRAAAMTGVGEDAPLRCRTDGTNTPMDTLRQRLYAYLVDSYLAEQGLGKA